jgi:hypothetical protein
MQTECGCRRHAASPALAATSEVDRQNAAEALIKGTGHLGQREALPGDGVFGDTFWEWRRSAKNQSIVDEREESLQSDAYAIGHRLQIDKVQNILRNGRRKRESLWWRPAIPALWDERQRRSAAGWDP